VHAQGQGGSVGESTKGVERKGGGRGACRLDWAVQLSTGGGQRVSKPQLPRSLTRLDVGVKHSHLDGALGVVEQQPGAPCGRRGGCSWCSSAGECEEQASTAAHFAAPPIWMTFLALSGLRRAGLFLGCRVKEGAAMSLLLCARCSSAQCSSQP